MKHYVMIQRNDRYWIVGPFASQEAAAEWGRATYSPDDDPRWQTMKLADASAAPRVLTPAEATAAPEGLA